MPWSSFVRRAALSLQLLYRRIGQSLTQAEHRVLDYCTKTTPRRRLSRIAGILLFGCMSIGLMGNTVSCQGCKSAAAIFFGPGVALFIPDNLVTDIKTPSHPKLKGSDGSQTGIASFLGNFTAITEPSGSYFLVARDKDCSLSMLGATSPLDGTATVSAATTNYERVLHQLASLSTTPDVYPHGCVDSNLGISTRLGVLVGQTTSGVLVSAVVSNASSNSVYIFTASADLSAFNFKPLSSLPYAAGVNTADLNGDKNGDLVVVNGYGTSTPNISVLLGNADGSFQTPVTYSVGGSQYAVSAVIDDVNGDGKLDIVTVSNDQQISVLLGNGNGTFQPAQSFAAPTLPGNTSNAVTPILSMITADVNGDSKKDIICSNGAVLLGSGTGTFTAVATPSFPYTTASPSGYGPGMASGDLNNDGKVDIVLNIGPVIHTYLGKGDGTFASGPSYASLNNSGYVTVSDLDGDGNADIYTGLANGGYFTGDDSNNAAAYALMGKGDGTFVGALQAAGAYNGANLGDVNGDGIPDLISNATGQSNQTLPTFTVQLGTGQGAFTSASSIPAAPTSFTGTTSALTSPVTITNANTVGATSYAVADLNGDGKADLVFVDNGLTAINPGSGFPITYPAPIYFVALSKGDGTFAAPLPYNFPQIAPASGFDNSVTANTVQIADFNHDGHPDLIFTYNEQAGGPGTVPYNQGFAILTGKGDGTFSTTAILTPTYSSTSASTTAFVPTVLSTADLNGDGKPDLIVNAPGTTIINFQLQTQLQTYIGNGDGTFKTPTTISAANEYGIPVVADFNKDGKPDLAFLAETSASQAELVIALGHGDGTFATPTVLNLTGGDSIRNASLAAADFNADGNPDLALIDSADYSGVFYGNGDGTFTSVPQSGYIVPKDLLNIAAGSPAIAVDLNKDSKLDILAGSTILLNLYGSAPVVTNQASTTTALTASSSSITTGSSIKFTATITPAAGSTATPTGTVTFYNGAVSLGTGTVSSGVATLTTSALTTAGSDSISAIYSGDTNFTGSTSASVVVTVTAIQISVPNVVGLTQTAASTAITTAGLTVGTVNTATSNTVAAGSVISQSPAAGTAVTAGATINLLVSTGAPPTPGLTLQSGTANLSFARGATTGNSTTITVTPTSGFTGSVAFAATLTSSPAGATNLPTLSFGSTSPVTIIGSTAGSATLTITTSSPTTGAVTMPVRPGTRWSIAGGVTLACMLMLGLPSRRRRLRTLLGMVALFGILAGGIIGCGGKGNTTTNNTGTPGTTAGSYTITVSASSGSTTAQTTIVLTLN